MKILISMLLLIASVSLSSAAEQRDPPIAYGFDYPIGDRGVRANGDRYPINERIDLLEQGYNTDRNQEYNNQIGVARNNSRGSLNGSSQPPSTWYNFNDVGNYDGGTLTSGLHSAEDWHNSNTRVEAGAPVYVVADGKVADLWPIRDNAAGSGWAIVVQHRLPNLDYVYSVYFHVTSHARVNRLNNIVLRESDLGLSRGQVVRKGEPIAAIAHGITDFPGIEHLHFEIRRGIFRSNTDFRTRTNRNLYYTNDGTLKRSGMTLAEVEHAMELMRRDGIVDPSDFIDDHREIRRWSGNGSLISYHSTATAPHLNPRLDITHDDYPYALTKDVSLTRSRSTIRGVNFFQWQGSQSCPRIEISYPGSATATITAGAFNSRKRDITLHNVQLPYVLAPSRLGRTIRNNGQDWIVMSIAIGSGYQDGARLAVNCTNKSATQASYEQTVGGSVIIDGYKWSGTASVIARLFEEGLSDSSRDNGWPYGASQDIITVEPSDHRPIVFFQWMPSTYCSRLRISSSYRDANVVKVMQSKWNDTNVNARTVNLPHTVSSLNDAVWNLVSVAFDSPIAEKTTIQASCSY